MRSSNLLRAAELERDPTDKETRPARRPGAAWRSLRLAQIRALASLLSHIEKRPRGQTTVRRLRQTGFSPLMNRMLGFRGSFASLAEAERVAHRFIPSAHEHPDEIGFGLALAESTRESDYPVLFHLAPVAVDLRRVF